MDTLGDFGKDFPNLPNQDLNQVWKILSQLQSSNPKKYRQFLDHLKSEKEKSEKFDSILPKPWLVYQVKATVLKDNFICYINIMAWERIKYPEDDQPISLMIGAELLKPRSGELVVHVAINDKAITEIQKDRDLEKEFQSLVVKFVSDNYSKYRFYSNSIRVFQRQNDIQYYGQMPKDPKILFMRKKSTDINHENLLDMLKQNEPIIPEPEIPENAPTLLDALEEEMKNAKITDPKPETPEKAEKSKPDEISKKDPISKKDQISKKDPFSKKDQISKKPMIIEEITETEKPEVEPVHKIDNSNPNYFKVTMSIPNVTFDQVMSHVSPRKLVVHIPGKFKLDLELPENLKDEAVKARFNKEKFRLTFKIPKLEIFEEKQEEMFDEDFMTNLQKGLKVTKS